MFGISHLSVLQWMWVGVMVTTVIFLIVSALSIIPKPSNGKRKIRGKLVTAGVLGIFLASSGITAWGNLPKSDFGPAVTPVAETMQNPLNLRQTGAIKLITPTGTPLNNDGANGSVIFTFDDGPDIYSPSVVAELTQLNIHGIFFDIGAKVKEYPSVVNLEIASGDEVGDHTYDHQSLTGLGTGQPPLTLAEVRRELATTIAAIKWAGAPTPTLYRPPYGAVSAADDQVAHSLGLRLVMDNSQDDSITDSNDWQGWTPQRIASFVESQLAQKTRIVAFHDGIDTAPNTIAALPLIAAWMQAHDMNSTLTLPADTTGQIVPNLQP